MDAFDISPANTLEWLKTVEPEQHRLCIEQLDEVLAPLRTTTLPAYVSVLTDILDHDKALEFFESIKSALQSALVTYETTNVA